MNKTNDKHMPSGQLMHTMTAVVQTYQVLQMCMYVVQYNYIYIPEWNEDISFNQDTHASTVPATQN